MTGTGWGAHSYWMMRLRRSFCRAGHLSCDNDPLVTRMSNHSADTPGGGGGGIHTLTPRLGDMQDLTITISMYI